MTKYGETGICVDETVVLLDRHMYRVMITMSNKTLNTKHAARAVRDMSMLTKYMTGSEGMNGSPVLILKTLPNVLVDGTHTHPQPVR